MRPALTARDRFYLVTSALMVLMGLTMVFRIKLAWNMSLAWFVALGFIGVGAYRLWVAWKALRK